MRLVIGCPVYRRPEQIRRWIRSVKEEEVPEKLLAFVATKGDDPTIEAIQEETRDGSFQGIEIVEGDWGEEGNDHYWTEARVQAVAKKRNELLRIARSMNPDFFLSLDSDVFAPRGGILRLLETIQELEKGGIDCAAISPRVLIWNYAVSAMTWERGLLALVDRRKTGLLPVDVLPTAACLMTKTLLMDDRVEYGVALEGRDYKWVQDERRRVDGWSASEMVYWSRKAKELNYRLWLLASLTFPHEMASEPAVPQEARGPWR